MSKIPTNRLSLQIPSKVVFRQPRTSATTQPIIPSGGDSSNHSFRIGERVIANEKSGTVSFTGRTQFAEGEWIGVTLDKAEGKNDGSYNGMRYFETDANRGLFCRPDKVQHLSLNGGSQRTSLYNSSRLSLIADQINTTSRNTTIDTLDPLSIKNLQIGDRVVIRGTKYGTLKYIGRIHVNEGIWCGIKLEGPLGRHNGKIEGVRYFRCQHRFGIFAPLRHVEKVAISSKESQGRTRESIISTDSYNQFRGSSSPDSNLSELSTSSTSLNHFPSRSPTKTGQQNPSARKTSLSTEISSLLEKIKEKDIYIGKLQQQNDKDRSELSHASEKINEMEIHIIALQQKYDMKENENKHLIKQQHELTQRLEDLQFQLEEDQYPESDNDHLTIPDNHRLLSPNEIAIYEKTKEKVVELESITRKLTQEKQIFQEELKRHHALKEKEKLTNTFIDELKEQIELLKSQVIDLQNIEEYKTSELEEKEVFYRQQIKEYQLKLEQITKQEQNVQLRLSTLEQEKQTSEKRIHDLLSELKRHKEHIVPDLETQCQILKSDLQNQERTANMALTERETYYQQQLKEYQDNINQATHETEKVRVELEHIQQENNIKEKTTNSLINELKQNYEKIQADLNDREHQKNLILNQRESDYQKQIQEYEDNLNRATRQSESIQTDLAKLAEDKVSHETNSTTIINSLKQDYERQYEILKTQLIELQDQDSTQNMASNERTAHYEIQIKEYQMKIDQDAREIQTLQTELINLQEENITHEEQLNQTIDTLKRDFEKLQNELHDQEHKANMTLNEYELEYKQQIEEYKNNLEHANQQIQNLQTELEELQKEKLSNENQLNKIINKLKQNYETLQTELQDQDHTQNMASNEREAHYQTQIKEYEIKREQSLLEIQDLQTKLTKLQEEKTTNENQLKETINTLKQDDETQYKELRAEIDELNERERKVHKDLHQRESQFDQQIQEYQDKLEQANLKTQHIQAELVKLHEEKTKSNDIINSLKQALSTLKAEYQDQDHTQNMALNEREVHYQSQIKEHQANREKSLLEIQTLQSELAKLQEEKTIRENELHKAMNTLEQDVKKLQNELNERERKEKKILNERESQYEQEIDEYQKNLELSIIQNQDIQSELTKLQEEKESNENNLNEMINSLKQDFENQIQIFKTENIELQEQYDAKTKELIQKEQQLSEYRTKFDQLNEQIIDSNQQSETKMSQIHQLKSELDQKQQANKQVTNIKQQYEQTQNELIQRTENLTVMNETLIKELEELKIQNEQLLKTTDNKNKTTEEKVVIDQLTQQVNYLQLMHTDLLEKQASMEQEYAEEKKAQEKIQKEQIGEYQMNIALMKSEYMVEMENTKLDHDQAILRLKTELQQALAPKKKK